MKYKLTNVTVKSFNTSGSAGSADTFEFSFSSDPGQQDAEILPPQDQKSGPVFSGGDDTVPCGSSGDPSCDNGTGVWDDMFLL